MWKKKRHGNEKETQQMKLSVVSDEFNSKCIQQCEAFLEILIRDEMTRLYQINSTTGIHKILMSNYDKTQNDRLVQYSDNMSL